MTTQNSSSLFTPLIGQVAHGCWLGYGSVLFLEFGESQPLLDRSSHPKGDYGLWCDCIEWRIEKPDQVIAGSEDSRATMESGIQQIEGKTFVSGEISGPAGDSILRFSDGLIFRTFVITSEEKACWSFRDREGKYFLLGPDGASVEERPRQQEVRKPR
jgi:hypothetical protein